MDHLNFDTLDWFKICWGRDIYICSPGPCLQGLEICMGFRPYKVTQGVDEHTSVRQLNLFSTTREHPVKMTSSVLWLPKPAAFYT